MIRDLAQKWWGLALRGLVAIAFGVALLVWQGTTLDTVLLLFGIFALVAGVIAGIVALSDRTKPRWWVLLLEGAAGAIIGLIALFWPGISGLWLLYLIVAWGILNGILQVLAALALRREVAKQWWYALFGAVTIVLGLVLLLIVGPDLLANLWLVGFYAVVFGILHLLLAWRLRRWATTPRGKPVA